VSHFALQQKIWDHTGYTASARQNGVGQKTHEAYLGATIDQGVALPGQTGPERTRAPGKHRIDAG
jgi:hypothetical protein